MPSAETEAAASSGKADPQTTQSFPPPGVPQSIGKYRVLGRLGQGATSEVFLAHDGFNDRLVAIKCMRPRKVLANEFESRFAERFFAAEAAMVGRLNHPNVVKIYDAVNDAEQPYIVMEHVAGVTLREFCDPAALLTLEQVVEVGFKCAMALGYVARQGLIHRDVKPANILVVTHRQEIIDLKIADFGSVLDPNADVTQIHRVGSLAYMAPEQLEGGELDSRADIYGLAAVLYHLISGRPPFGNDQTGALLQSILYDEPDSLIGTREGVSPALDQLILGALSKTRDGRPADWDTFGAQLAALIANREVPRGDVQRVLDSERFNLLRSLEFFADFGENALWEVVRRARWQRYPQGRYLCRAGQEGRRFHILAQGEVDVFREGRQVATLGAGTSVGEMAYLAPNPALRKHAADIVANQPCTTVSFTPDSMLRLNNATRHRFDAAFIHVLVRRLHAAHEALDHPRRIL
jgi:tRNA A-37 threonylcarbamoyl transferase component Bud32